MLHIARLKIRNFKSFKYVDIPIPDSFVCIAGPNGSGKCVDGETEIFLANGTTSKIRDLIEEAMVNGHVEKIDDGYIAQHPSSKSILCLDSKTLKVTKKKIAAFVKRKSPNKMLKVKTRSGREIVATEYHPFFIFDGNQIRSIRADELKEKIRIAIPRILPSETKETLFLELLDEITVEDNIYVPYNEKIAKFIFSKKAQNTWGEFSTRLGIPPLALTSFIHSKQSILFPYLVKALRDCGLTDLEIANRITHLKADGGGGSVRIPWHNSSDFCRFLGYLLAEGSISESNNQLRFTNGSKEIISDFVAIAKNLFGLTAHVYTYKENAYDVIINNVALRNLLLNFGMSYEGSKGKNIPSLILKHSTNEHLSNLLNGLYSGDGYVSKNSIEITLKSKKLIKGIGLILLRLGIIPRRTTVTKRETKSNFVGSYFKISVFEVEALRLFSQNIKLVHHEKYKRLESLLLRDSNPNVDLIEANSLVKTAIRDLGINVKKSKKQFPRLDAYCYNQCLPSRYGVKHLLSNVMEPLTVQKNIQSVAVQKLQLVSNSHIFWDEIEKIERIEPREDWVYDLTIGEHHNFIANGIFVHNSNFTDGIRFALGEISLRSLRAKRVTDLIFAGAKAGEVTLQLNNGNEKYELQRAIRKDGKIRYRLNGKNTKRYTVLNTLRQYDLDESGRNIIAQGEVQRIVQMNGKERRGIIDSVAGVAEFEQKKKEALKELDIVNGRIKDVKLVMGERLAFLKELEQEREQALHYQNAQSQAKSARASLVSLELSSYQKSLQSLKEQEEKIRFNLDAKQGDLAEFEKKIEDLETQRSQVSQSLQSKQKTAGVIQKIEELRASVSSKKQSIEDSEILRTRSTQELGTIKKEIKQEKRDIGKLEEELQKLRQDVLQSEKRVSQMPAASLSSLESLETRLEQEQGKVHSLREKLISLEGELSSKQEILKIKQDELKTVEGELSVRDASPLSKEINSLEKQKTKLDDALDQSFSRTKELNAKIAELDRKLLEFKERASILRVRVAPAFSNPALQQIELWKKSQSGIYGTIAELIEFKPEHAASVEAAAGGRLLYVVVEDSQLATRLITRLKSKCEGRVTFIPLKDVRTHVAGAKKGYKPLSNYLKFSPDIKPAIDFVFGSTLFVPDMKTAQTLRSYRVRMVTKEGEIFEPSGLITGGRVKTSLLVASQLKALDRKIGQLKKEKENTLADLVSIREDESRLRSQKAEKDVAIKTVQLKIKQAEEEAEKLQAQEARKNSLIKELHELEEILATKGRDRQVVEKDLKTAEEKLRAFKTELEETRKSSEELKDEEQRRREEIVSRFSSLKAQLEGKQNELQIRKQAQFNRQEKTKELEKEIKLIDKKLRSIKKEVVSQEEELLQSEEKIRHKGRQIDKLFAQIKEFEDQLLALGEQRGKKKLDVERLLKDQGELHVKKATAQTRLEDLTKEYGPYEEVEKLSLPKEQLMQHLQEAEATIQNMGNVNMAAIEMYEKKKQELGEIKEKIEKLATERKAILKMMKEIEERKRIAFFETFDAVADNFKDMFKHLAIGEGILYLDNPNEPFESGLHIKLRRGNKEYPLASLSGGENSLIALMFIFALQFFKPSPFYVLDEVDAALDKENSKNLAKLITAISKNNTQFLLVTHNDVLMASADTVLGVTKIDGTSKMVGVRLASAPAT